jgi:hypothetical protein
MTPKRLMRKVPTENAWEPDNTGRTTAWYTSMTLKKRNMCQRIFCEKFSKVSGPSIFPM